MKFMLVLIALFSFTACSSTGSDTNERSINESHIDLQDGRVVTCLTYAVGHKGGLSCDWANAK